MSEDRICGPYFAERTVSGFFSLYVLENYHMPQLQDMEGQVIFQQDGAPPPFSHRTETVLPYNFPKNGLIGRGGTISWLSRSPDLTPIDFHLWGYVKDHIYVLPHPQTLDLLRD
ncbi:hypothetical protein L798_15518 [Zootermopsis nevadensis]|uniref:Uncharacterized protein n=1 Tax=Zootermopsis nevadensis TaxID=136037 RepID=A0A067QMH1_ZOONE|nr:hypothetical protein L798_15518 [Zootermopsis nevadensis]